MSHCVPSCSLVQDKRVKDGSHGLPRQLVFLAMTVLVCLLSVSSAQAQDTTSNLLGHWKMDETSGTTVNDSSGNNYHGAFDDFSAPDESWRPDGGVIDGALWINGPGGEHVDFYDWLAEFNLDENYTLSAWVYLKDHGTDHHIIKAGVYSTANANQQYMMEVDGGRLNFITGDRTVGDKDTFGPVSYNVWQHLVCVEDAGTKRCYVNGEPSGTPQTNDTVDPFGALARFMIGRRKDASSQDLNGMVDDVRIYSRPLSETDIKALYTRSDKYCENPTAGPGEFNFNTDRRALQYCDGDNWVMAGLGSYMPGAVHFTSGTDTYLARGSDLTDNADTGKITGSFWFRRNSTGQQRIYFADSARFMVQFSASDRVNVFGQNAASTDVLSSFSAPITDSGWHHAMFSYDLSDASKAHLYIDGVEDTGVSTFVVGETIDVTQTEHLVGKRDTGQHYDGDLADFWLDFGVYVDLSVAENRARFLSASGMPMYFGEDGSLPTGLAPDVFLSGDTDSWHNNRGTGGGFTENGALTEASTPIPLPSALDLTDGLVGYWKLDETSGTTAADSAGTASCSLQNMAGTEWTGGVFSGALEFDGSSDRIDCAVESALAIAGDLTLSAWVYRDNSGTTDVIAEHAVSGEAESDNGLYEFYLNTTNELALAWEYGSGSNVTENADVPVSEPNGSWVHYSVTRDASTRTVSFYENGRLLTVDSPYGEGEVPTGGADGTFTIGSDHNGGADDFDGKIDDVRVYNRVLSQNEIAALYSGTCSSPDGAGGTLIYNTDYKVMQYCNGVEWVAMSKINGTGGSGCASPAGTAGEIIFDSAESVMQYCNSQDWVNIGKVAAPADGLVGHWKLNEDSGTTAVDSTGSNNGTMQGGLNAGTDSVAGRVGSALDFDGVGDYINIGDVLELSLPLTMSAWIKLDDVSGSHMIVTNDKDDTTHSGVWLQTSGDQAVISFGDASGGFSGDRRSKLSPAGTLSIGNWYHITAVVRGETDMDIYIDGVDLGGTYTGSGGAIQYRTGANAVISSASYPFPGALDDIRIYDRALSVTEIKQLYNATR